MNKMMSLLILGLVFGSSLSTDDNKTILQDTTQKNPNYEVEGHLLKDCKFLRTYTVKQPVNSVPGHSNIFFHCKECLDANLVMIGETDVWFNYDDDTSAKTAMMRLPPGCPPVNVVRKPTVCENGVKLGKHVVSDVTQIVTKELVENPLNVLAPSDSPTLNPEDVNRVTVELESLEKEIEKALNAPHDDVDNGDSPDSVEEFPEGVVRRVYTFPNTTVEVLTRPLEPNTQPRVLGPDDTLAHEPLNLGPVGETGVSADRNNGLGPEQTVPGETMVPENPAELLPGTYHTKTTTLVPSPENPNVYVEEIIVETLVDPTKPRIKTKTWTRDLTTAPVGEPVGPDSPEGRDLRYPDGTVRRPDGTTVGPDGSVTDPSGNTTHPDGTVTDPQGVTTNPTTGEVVETPETPVGSNGKPVPHGEPTNPPQFQRYVEKIPIPGTENKEHTQLVQVRGEDPNPETPVPTPLNFTMPPPPRQPFAIPPTLFTDVSNVADDLAQTLADTVNEKSKCLMDRIFHEKTYQIELVCASTAAKNEHDTLFQNDMVRELFCPSGNCNDFLEGVIENMIAHNLANTGEDFSIDSKTYKSGILPGSGSA